ncbi:MAG: hypothetical protein R3A48_29000 [Polyangiales bacterium]
MALSIVDTPNPSDAPPPRHVPMSTAKVYGGLAAITLGIVAMMSCCCVAFMYYLEVRGQR